MGNAAQISARWDGRRWVKASVVSRDRLRSLLAEVDMLTPAALEQERETLGPCSQLDIERAELTKARLAIASKTLMKEMRAFLDVCPIHGEAREVGCPECPVADRESGMVVR